MRHVLLFVFLLVAVDLSAWQRVRFKDNYGNGFLGMYNPVAGVYAGPSIEFGYSPVLLNAGNTVFLLADVTGRLSAVRKADAGAVGFTADLELRIYNKRVNRARYGFSFAYGWNCAVGMVSDNPLVPVWGFDWMRAGLILGNRGAGGTKQRLYYVEFQEWEGQYFAAFGVEFCSVKIAPRLHSRLTYCTGRIKMRKYR